MYVENNSLILITQNLVEYGYFLAKKFPNNSNYSNQLGFPNFMDFLYLT